MKMHKRILLIFIALFVSLSFWPVQASSAREFILQDDADLFSASQEETLQNLGEQIVQKYDITIFILTSNEANSYDPSNYAYGLVETFGQSYISSGYIGYAIDMADRSYYAGFDSTQKDFELDIEDSQAISNAAYEGLSQGNYYQSALNMLTQSEKQLDIATSHFQWLAKIKNNPVYLIGLVVVPLFASLILSGLMSLFQLQKHKEKQEKHEANDYMESPVSSLAGRRLIHIYETRAPKPKPQDSHGSGGSFSSGGSGHGGSGGHF
jgi:uncharacterized membrane protein YgcG